MEDSYDASCEDRCPSPLNGDHDELEIRTIGSQTHDSIVNENAASESARKKQRTKGVEEIKRRSWVWQHFDLFNSIDDKGEKIPKARCKYCKTVYIAHSHFGTANASNHINNKCAAYKKYVGENPVHGKFDKKIFCRMFAEAIMFHAYSFSMVEHVKHRELLTYLNPDVIHVTRNTIAAYCLKEHDRLKVSLLESLSRVSSRICFTSDCWSSKVTSRGYLSLTAHYIDDNWKSKSHILNFKYFPPPHTGLDIYGLVIELLKEWNLEGKTFSMTCDNAGSMDVMVRCLKGDLQSRNPLPCGGDFFHVRCSANILNLIVQAGLSVIDESIVKLRAACSYIDGSNRSDHRLIKFQQCLKEKCSNFKGNLILDVLTRWNSTYLMLNRAFLVKDAFDQYALLDKDFAFTLSEDEWKVVEFVVGFLEPFYNITVLFSGTQYLTSNLYFHNIFAIEKLLTLGHVSPVKCIRDMSVLMLDKFEKYWADYSILLSIAVMLDPCYKLALVRNHLSHLYADSEVVDRVKRVKDAFIKLYEFYDIPATSSASSNSDSSVTSSQFSMSSILETFESSNASAGDALTAIEAYLNAPLVPRSSGFDILKYWQSSTATYPTLAHMAKDILAVPITSVASESSFSMGSRTLTKYRASLLPKNVEALVCTQNWLFGYSKEEEADADFEVVKENFPEDVDHECLPSEG